MCIRDSIRALIQQIQNQIDITAVARSHQRGAARIILHVDVCAMFDQILNHVDFAPVSYTHLDVYKRQRWPWALR